MVWSEGEVEIAKSLWQKGVSASEISVRLGRRYTRNAIIGKMNRMLLTKKEGAKGPSPRTRVQPKVERVPLPPKKKAPPKPTLVFKKGFRQWSERVHNPGPLNIPPSRKLPLLDRGRHECAYITDEGNLYCGHPVASGKRYCEGHYKIMYIPSQLNG